MTKKEKEGKGIDLSLGMCIQSINFDSGLQVTGSGSSKKADKKNTPLLDSAQVDQNDSDHEWI